MLQNAHAGVSDGAVPAPARARADHRRPLPFCPVLPDPAQAFNTVKEKARGLVMDDVVGEQKNKAETQIRGAIDNKVEALKEGIAAKLPHGFGHGGGGESAEKQGGDRSG